MGNENLKNLIAEKDKWYKKYLKKRDAKVKELEILIGSIWWKLNKIEWNHDNNEVIVTAEDQGGWPFETFKFKYHGDDWLDLLEEVLKLKKDYNKRKYKL